MTTLTIENKTAVILNKKNQIELTKIGNWVLQFCDKTVTEDEGTCVRQCGIYVKVAKKDYITSYRLVSQRFQGNLSNAKYFEPALKYLQTNYPELNAHYFDGYTD